MTIANLTANSALVSDAGGKIGASATVSSTELGYLDNVSSAIQTQIDTKAPINNPSLTGDPQSITPGTSDSDTSIATTAYVKNNLTSAALGATVWTLSGNTVGASDFIGSTNAQDVVLKANNVEGLRLTKSGNLVGVG